MFTVFRMCMVMHPARPVIDKVRGNDQAYGRNEQPGFVMGKELFKYEKYKTCKKDDHRHKAVMMFAVAMV
jgi:hypothetical protein